MRYTDNKSPPFRVLVGSFSGNFDTMAEAEKAFVEHAKDLIESKSIDQDIGISVDRRVIDPYHILRLHGLDRGIKRVMKEQGMDPAFFPGELDEPGGFRYDASMERRGITAEQAWRKA